MKKFVNEDKICKKDLNVAIKDAINNDNNTINFIIGSFYTYHTVVEELKKNTRT